MVRRNDVGDFYTQGQEKCPHCGLYFGEAQIYSHMDRCVNNPVNQEEQDD